MHGWRTYERPSWTKREREIDKCGAASSKKNRVRARKVQSPLGCLLQHQNKDNMKKERKKKRMFRSTGP